MIGGGPAGLMAAEALLAGGAVVDLYDAMPSVGRKFLLAGKGGLNLTHSEPIEQFRQRYTRTGGAPADAVAVWLAEFGPQSLRDWALGLGVATFIGSSGRVFPAGMKAAPLLRAWLHRLRGAGLRLHMRQRWLGWQDVQGVQDSCAADHMPKTQDAQDAQDARDAVLARITSDTPNTPPARDVPEVPCDRAPRRAAEHAADRAPIRVRFGTPYGVQVAEADALLLALGGASWPRLGSDGAWVPWLAARGVEIAPLQPANCGFDVGWSDYFAQRFAGAPIKSVRLHFDAAQGRHFDQQGEFVITNTGVEGSLVYAASSLIRDTIAARGAATIYLDLVPGRDEARLATALAKGRGARSLPNHLREQTGLAGAKAALLRERWPADELARRVARSPADLARELKAWPLVLTAARPIDEAISSAGGVRLEALDAHLMLRALPGVFCAGEMLDWEAPTGGYLLTASMASGLAAGRGVLAWWQQRAGLAATIAR